MRSMRALRVVGPRGMIVDSLDSYRGIIAGYDGEPWRAGDTIVGGGLSRVGIGWVSEFIVGEPCFFRPFFLEMIYV